MSSRAKQKAQRKFRFERAVGRYLANPTVRTLNRLGIHTALATELETIGRKTGVRRTVPVLAKFDGTGAWVISQHGTQSGGAQHHRESIRADPSGHTVADRVGRIRSRGRRCRPR